MAGVIALRLLGGLASLLLAWTVLFAIMAWGTDGQLASSIFFFCAPFMLAVAAILFISANALQKRVRSRQQALPLPSTNKPK